MKKNTLGLTLTSLACAAFLSACGGGGSDATTGAGAGTGASSGSSSGNPSDIVTQVAAATYPVGSYELAAFTRLNEQRGKCGFGLMAQNAKIDQAASAHRAYLTANPGSPAHSESPALPGFTGVDVGARLTAAGYVWMTAGEVVLAGSSVGFPSGDVATEIMLDLPYHSAPTLAMLRDVGISQAGSVFVMDTGEAAGVVWPSSPQVLTYPCNGTADVQPVLSGEVPSPFPTEASATWGPTVSVFGTKVQVKNASINGPTGSVAIKAIYSDGGTLDPNGHCDSTHACIIPVPLAASTNYSVHIDGTQAGVPFTKDFSFTTGRQG